MRGILAIVGGGASGLCAAVRAAESGRFSRVIVLERGPRVGRKLLATGNGRCNLTNRYASPENYRCRTGRHPEFVRPALEAFNVGRVLSFFESLGIVPLEEEDGKIYPRSLQAASVLDVLRFRAEELGVELCCDQEVTGIRPAAEGFVLLTAQGKLRAERVLLAAGGAASPKLGGTDSGCRLLEELGHSITPLLPSIVQLKTELTTIRPLTGIKVDGIVTLTGGDTPVSQTGEILFTDYGISGPPVMQVSCQATRLLEAGGKPVISLDLASEYTKEELFLLLKARAAARPEVLLENFLVGMFHKRVGQTALKAAGIAPLSRKAGSLAPNELNALVSQLKSWKLPVTGTMGLLNAQVTAGGAELSEFDPNTLESRLIPGLYACGEVLDIDGDCGGYNLQWAWSSAMLAIESMI